LVAFDLDLLRANKTIESYIVLKREAKDKEARDLLRESGAAVRYGFAGGSDELGVFMLSDGVIGMWPDLTERF
jgi:hypothetical protein